MDTPRKIFFSFFLSWASKTQPNHWTKQMANTRLAIEDPRTCPGPEFSHFLFFSFVRSHTFYFEGTELCVGPDPYRKGSISGH